MLEFEPLPQFKARNKPKRKAPENPVKNACMDWIRAHGMICNRQQCGMIWAINKVTRKQYPVHLAEEGSGDIVGCTKKGRYFEVETKPPKGGTWTDAQKRRKERVEARGGIYILARSIDDLAPLLNA